MNLRDRRGCTPRNTIHGGMALVLVAALSLAFAACGEDNPTVPPRDVTAPTVLTTDPIDHATAIPVDADIVFTFSEDLDPTTVTILSVTLQGPPGLVAGSVSSTGPIVSFDPSQTLTAGSLYTAFVTTAIRDLAGNALQNNVSIEFTTLSPGTSAGARVHEPREAFLRASL